MFQCFLSEVSTPLGLKLHTIAPTRVFHAKCFPTFSEVVESIWKPEPVALPTEYNLTEFHSTLWSAWKQDFQGTYINTTVVLLIEVCVSGVTQHKWTNYKLPCNTHLYKPPRSQCWGLKNWLWTKHLHQRSAVTVTHFAEWKQNI